MTGAEDILNKIEIMEYPGRMGEIYNRKSGIPFSINSDEKITETVYTRVNENLKKRKDINKPRVSSLGESIISDYSANLFKDSNLDYYLTKINNEYKTDKVLEKTKFRILKLVVARIMRVHTRLQVSFNQGVVTLIHSVINKLGLFYGQISQDLKKMQDVILAHEDRLKELEQFDAKAINKAEDIYSQLSSLEVKITQLENDEGRRNINKKDLTESAELMDSSENNCNKLENIDLKLGSLSKEFKSLSSWLKLMDERTVGNEKWLDLVSKRIRDYELNFDNLRKELFYELNTFKRETNEEIIVPKILNNQRFANKMAKMGENIKIQLGCGNDINENYINIDLRELSSVDIKADILKLPFSSNTIQEIYTSHLIEHFTIIDLKKRILPYWYELLKESGILRTVTPNVDAMIQRYNAGKIDFETLSSVIMGGQEYEGNKHYSLFNVANLTDLLKSAGFSRVEIVEEQRINGKCLEMEVIAIK